MNASREAGRYRGSKWVAVQYRPDDARPGDTPWRRLDNDRRTILDLAGISDSRNNAINSRIANKKRGPSGATEGPQMCSDIRPGPADSDSEVALRAAPRANLLTQGRCSCAPSSLPLPTAGLNHRGHFGTACAPVNHPPEGQEPATRCEPCPLSSRLYDKRAVEPSTTVCNFRLPALTVQPRSPIARFRSFAIE
jgi:hypothetical protein